MWLSFISYKKLRSICIRARVGHGYYTSLGMFELIVELIWKLAGWGGEDALAALASTGGISTLYHEVFDVSVENGVVVVVAGG